MRGGRWRRPGGEIDGELDGGALVSGGRRVDEGGLDPAGTVAVGEAEDAAQHGGEAVGGGGGLRAVQRAGTGADAHGECLHQRGFAAPGRLGVEAVAEPGDLHVEGVRFEVGLVQRAVHRGAGDDAREVGAQGGLKGGEHGQPPCPSAPTGRMRASGAMCS